MRASSMSIQYVGTQVTITTVVDMKPEIDRFNAEVENGQRDKARAILDIDSASFRVAAESQMEQSNLVYVAVPDIDKKKLELAAQAAALEAQKASIYVPVGDDVITATKK